MWEEKKTKCPVWPWMGSRSSKSGLMSHKFPPLFLPCKSYSSSPAELSLYFGSKFFSASRTQNKVFFHFYWLLLSTFTSPCALVLLGIPCIKVEYTEKSDHQPSIIRLKNANLRHFPAKENESAQSFRWSGHLTRTASLGTLWQFISLYLCLCALHFHQQYWHHW